MSDIRKRADLRLDQALAETGAADPRPRYRDLLRALKEKSPEGFHAATRYFEGELIPAIADGPADPLEEWLEFGRILADLTTEGETVQIDESGLSAPYVRPIARDRLVLHLPRSPRAPAIAIGMPRALSPAQAATHALLVEEAVRLP